MMDNEYLSPQMLGLLGMQLLQQSRGNQNAQKNPMAGILSLPMFNDNMARRNSVMPQSAQAQNTSEPNADSNEGYIPPYIPTSTSQPNAGPFSSSGPAPAPALSTTPGPAGALPGINPYFAQLKQAAQNSYPDNPLMQQVAMSQALLEGGVHPSKLANQSNNYFGIKSPSGVSMQTQEYVNGMPTTQQASFAVNPSMQASFDQHRGLLGHSRYAPVMAANSPMDAFTALQRAGYATDPRYAAKLNSVYNRYVQPLYGV